MRRPTSSLPTADGADGADRADGLYRAAWRWHFYAGLFVAPVLLVLALSGLVMLLRGPLESALYGDLIDVVPGATAPRPPSEQVAAVRAEFPQAEPVLFVPPRVPTRATEIAVVPAGAHEAAGHDHDAATVSVFVDPYTARVLGSIDPGTTPYAWANAIHGSLLLGAFGDGLVETAAGLAVLLIGTGVFLAWPRRIRWRAALMPRPSIARRVDSRALHGAVGFWLAIPLLFFLLSGLTWTGVWGARLLQGWNTVAVERGPGTELARTHGDLNRTPLEEVPWPLEQAHLPASHVAAATPGSPHESPDIDGVVEVARAMGFEHFRINLPRGHEGVWTVSASTMADDTDDPRAERFVHIDRHTGRVLADIGFDDYSRVAQFMASGVPLHQGDLGRWNVVFNVMVCLAVVGLVSLAAVLWWQRRPRLAGFAPPRPDPRAWRRMVALMLVFALVFPLAAAAIAIVVGFDLMVVSRFAARQQPA